MRCGAFSSRVSAGAAVTKIEISGARHEFSSLPGVREDATDIALNIKRTAIRMEKDGPVEMVLAVEGPREVTAGDIIPNDSEVIICNPEHPICHLDEGSNIYVKMLVESGKGYAPAASKGGQERRLNWTDVDAIFTPVRRVSFSVGPARVGGDYGYDKLTLEVETDGTISPEDAVGLCSAHRSGPDVRVHQLRRNPASAAPGGSGAACGGRAPPSPCR